MSIVTHCTQKATFTRITKTADDYGGWTESTATVKSNWPVALHPMTGGERAYRQSLNVLARYKLFCPWFSGALEGDVCTIDGTAYNIVFIRDPVSKNHHLEMELELQRDG